MKNRENSEINPYKSPSTDPSNESERVSCVPSDEDGLRAHIKNSLDIKNFDSQKRELISVFLDTLNHQELEHFTDGRPTHNLYKYIQGKFNSSPQKIHERIVNMEPVSKEAILKELLENNILSPFSKTTISVVSCGLTVLASHMTSIVFNQVAREDGSLLDLEFVIHGLFLLLASYASVINVYSSARKSFVKTACLEGINSRTDH